MKYIALVALVLFCLTGYSQKTKTENVILVTLDGMRWQEIFRGAENRLISKDFVSDSGTMIKKYWAETPMKRREILMPFLWSVIAKQGVVLGDRDGQSFVNVTNQQWFSYPGYNEILTGFADDERIHSNDKFDNPNKTVLEFINSQKGYMGKVVAYSSWDVFPFIINTKRNGIPVNSGIVEATGVINDKEKALNELMHEVPNPLGDVRLDAFTFHYGFEYLKKNKPKVLYLSFDETDDFAHGGKYDLYLDAAHYTDEFLKTLWTWIQSNEQYKNKTTLIITADHGRGDIKKEDWKHHGIKMEHADQIWVAAIGPDTPASGLVAGQFYQNQIAKTISGLLRLEYVPEKKAGDAISVIMKGK